MDTKEFAQIAKLTGDDGDDGGSDVLASGRSNESERALRTCFSSPRALLSLSLFFFTALLRLLFCAHVELPSKF